MHAHTQTSYLTHNEIQWVIWPNMLSDDLWSFMYENTNTDNVLAVFSLVSNTTIVQHLLIDKWTQWKLGRGWAWYAMIRKV